MSTYSESSLRTLTAFFDNRVDADAAAERLVKSGVSRDNVRVVAGGASETTSAVTDDHKGFWASLSDFFMPDEDRYSYAEGLRRGGYLVTVSGLTSSQHDAALDILDESGSVDMEAREASWRSEGWSGYETGSTADISTSTYDRTSGSAGGSTGLAGSTGFAATSSAAVGGLSSGDEEVIPVLREELRVGKRDVNAGRVRVRSYVVETPVSEQVSLRDENVYLERRNVDRALTGNEALFQDRTIEAEEHREEAVVAKEARVTEEISLRRESSERTESVSDTVRHTEVEIEDERTETRIDQGSTVRRVPGA